MTAVTRSAISAKIKQLEGQLGAALSDVLSLVRGILADPGAQCPIPRAPSGRSLRRPPPPLRTDP